MHSAVCLSQFVGEAARCIYDQMLSLCKIGAAANGCALAAGSPLHSAREVALTGLGLTYALPMVSLLSALLTTAAETEQELVAVERTMHYLELPGGQHGTLGHEASGGVTLLSAVRPILRTKGLLELVAHCCSVLQCLLCLCR
jgi:hypothetical protein